MLSVTNKLLSGPGGTASRCHLWERDIQACLSRYSVGSSVTRILIHLSRLLLQSFTVLCCQFLLLPLLPQGSVPAAVTVCHGVPQTDKWGAGYPRGNLEELSSTGRLHGLPGLHNVVLQRPDPSDTKVVPALLQLPPRCRACLPVLSPDPLLCALQLSELGHPPSLVGAVHRPPGQSPSGGPEPPPAAALTTGGVRPLSVLHS